jgi:membrane protease YdiL (CAAX protease family)
MTEFIEKTGPAEDAPLDPIAEHNLIPATWMDLAIYLVGGVGMYFLASLVLTLVSREISLWTTVMLTLLNFLALAGGVYLLGIRRQKVSTGSMGLTRKHNLPRLALIGAAVAVLIIPIRLIGAMIGLGIEYLARGEITSLAMREGLFTTGFDTWYGVTLLVIGIGVLAPIAEELFFRGLLYDFFRQKLGVNWAIAISSILFGFAHFDSLAVVGSAMVMGVAMAYAVERTRSLWVSIFMHIATNAGAVLMSALLLQIQEQLQIPF